MNLWFLHKIDIEEVVNCLRRYITGPWITIVCPPAVLGNFTFHLANKTMYRPWCIVMIQDQSLSWILQTLPVGWNEFRTNLSDCCGLTIKMTFLFKQRNTMFKHLQVGCFETTSFRVFCFIINSYLNKSCIRVDLRWQQDYGTDIS